MWSKGSLELLSKSRAWIQISSGVLLSHKTCHHGRVWHYSDKKRMLWCRYCHASIWSHTWIFFWYRELGRMRLFSPSFRHLLEVLIMERFCICRLGSMNCSNELQSLVHQNSKLWLGDGTPSSCSIMTFYACSTFSWVDNLFINLGMHVFHGWLIAYFSHRPR